MLWLKKYYSLSGILCYQVPFWYQFCNFKHFLKAENSEDSLARLCVEFSIGLSCNPSTCETGYARNTPARVQFANIRKMVLCQGLPHCLRLCVDHAWHVIPKVLTQIYMHDRKIWKLFSPRGNGRKRAKCDQFFCPTSNFLDFCNPCFFYGTGYIAVYG